VVCRRTSDALDPGYGFPSENAGLAWRCAGEGISFVGPSPRALDLLGDKAKAKALAKTCGVPIIAGISGRPRLRRRRPSLLRWPVAQSALLTQLF
jgi:acetyl/propionyl-CoA carboxylase alpha subunit